MAKGGHHGSRDDPAAEPAADDSRLEAAGAAHYWVVDPDEPSVTAWSLVDGRYREAGRATGEQALELTEPYKVRIMPAGLVRAR